MPEIVTKMNSEEEPMSDGSISPQSRELSPAALSSGAELEVPKHPLQNDWTLWYFKNDRSKNWEDNLKQVITFDTVEDFWALYNHIEIVSLLGNGCDYSLFKKGIEPAWEDKANEKGGRWIYTIDKRTSRQCLDKYWLEVLMCLVGESFGENGVIVNGAVVNIRPKADKISIWISESCDSTKILAVGLCIKNRLQLKERMNFEVHNDTKTKVSSMIKAKFSI
jgi:translation initiation factor 4E